MLDQGAVFRLNFTMLKPQIKAVLFDKDGTLIDFMHTWYPVFSRFVDRLAEVGGMDQVSRDEVARLLGDEGSSISAESVFAHGSFEDILATLTPKIPGLDKSLLHLCFRQALGGSEIHARPIGEARKTLSRLRDQGYILGVATADFRNNTLQTLEKAGLLDCFHFVGSEDMVPRGKPFPDLMEAFCADQNLEPGQVAMVGDTRRDMDFARNSGAGQSIFVTCTFPNDQVASLADTVIRDINDLAGIHSS